MTSFLHQSSRRKPRAFTCATLTCLGLSLISPLRAQETPHSATANDSSADSHPAPEPDMEQARAAFERGRALMESEDWLGASAQFVIAAQTKNTPGIRYHIAFCQEKAGKMAEALQGYELTRELLKASPAEDVAKLIPAAIQRVRPQVGAVVLKDLPLAASVAIDQEVYGPIEQIVLNPGLHQLVITQDGYEPFRQQVEVAASGTEIVRVKLVPLSPGDKTEVAAQALPDTAPSDGLRKGVFWSGVGLVIAGAATSGVGAGIFIEAKSSIKKSTQGIKENSDDGLKACDGATGSLKPACDNVEASEKRKHVGAILMVAGGSALVVGGVSALVAEYFWPHAPVTVDVGLTQQTPTFGLRGRF